MATFTKLPSGTWRVQIRRKGRYVSETFQRREDARRWALGADVKADRGEAPISSRIAKIKTFGELIDLHIEDMTAVGKTPLRSKTNVLALLKRELGKCKISALDRERLIKFGRDRADQGAGPVTLGIDMALSHPLRKATKRSRSRCSRGDDIKLLGQRRGWVEGVSRLSFAHHVDHLDAGQDRLCACG